MLGEQARESPQVEALGADLVCEYQHVQIPRSRDFPIGCIRKRPFLRVTLRNGPQHRSFFALVDSGADCCAFPVSLGKSLGLIGSGDDDFQAVMGMQDGEVGCCYRRVMLQLDGVEPYEIFALFNPRLDVEQMSILWQDGFFDHFQVLFNLPANQFCVIVPDQGRGG